MGVSNQGYPDRMGTPPDPHHAIWKADQQFVTDVRVTSGFPSSTSDWYVTRD